MKSKLHLSNDHVGPGVISVFEGSESEIMSRDSLKEGISSFKSLDTIILNVDGRIIHKDIPMLPHILSEEEINATLQRR